MNTIRKLSLLVILSAGLLSCCNFNRTEYEKDSNSTFEVVLSSDDATAFVLDVNKAMRIDTSYGLSRYPDLYSNLLSGDYVFGVRVMQTLNSPVIDETYINTAMKPSSWLTTSAIISFMLLFVLLIIYLNFTYLRKRTNKLKLAIASSCSMRECHINQMNMGFFANMSHEIGNPFNQLDQDVLKLKVTQFDIVNAVDLWMETFKIVADGRGIRIEKEGMTTAFFTLLDYDKLEKILNILFTNALMHTSDNGVIRFHLRLMNSEDVKSLFHCRVESQNEYIFISIYNNGKQIPDEKLSEIFKKYYQRKSVRGKYSYGGGTGIGLYYVERLVNLHHGYIQAFNEPKGGVVFGFAVPVNDSAYLTDEYDEKDVTTADTELANTENPLESESIQAQKPRLLIVGDNVEIARYLKSILSNDYQVINKYSAESALDEISYTLPDVILSDVVMDELSGYNFCKSIKGDSMYSHIPLILIADKLAFDEQIQGLELGADAYVGKPFNPNYLHAVIRSQIKNRNNMRKCFREQSFAEPINGELSSQDKIFIKELYSLMDECLNYSELNIENICEILHISRSKFNYKIKRLTGETPNNFFKKYKLNRAANLLREGGYNVSEVSMMTGFGTISHFSVCFKKHFGINPSRYKSH